MIVKEDGSRHPTVTEDGIYGFFGEYRFLSNFHYCNVEYEGIKFKSSEHAYMAAKTTDLNLRELIRDCKTPSDAKKMGQKISLRDDWELIKVSAMTKVLVSKFQSNRDLADLLLATGDKYLEESNNWGDKFWGVYYKYDDYGNCASIEGKNQLGRILMLVRKAVS